MNWHNKYVINVYRIVLRILESLQIIISIIAWNIKMENNIKILGNFSYL